MQSSKHPPVRRVRHARRPVPIAILFICAGSALNCSDAVAPTEPHEAIGTASDGVSASTIIVSSAAELIAALSPENAGRRILVRAGSYAIDQPLTVPDGVTLEGEGVMLFDAVGLPAGFAASTRTALAMAASTAGNVLTLGDGVTVRALAVEDLPGRVGNAIAVVSRGAGDRVSATISETEILNPNAHGQVPAGPTGCGLAVWTNNPNAGADPAPHEGAAITVRLIRSLISSPSSGTGCGLFAMNFAPFATVAVALDGNVVGGGIIANGGVSRPDAVHDSRVAVQSRRNLYRDDSADPCTSPHLGFNLVGGSGSLLPLPLPPTLRNSLQVHSTDDRVEGFAMGILARGGLRFTPNSDPSSDNSIDIELLGTTISTPSCGGAPFVADFRLAAAQVTNASLVAGDGNMVRVLMRNVTGSGTRSNLFADVLGPSGPQPASLQGSGNRLEIIGSPQAFAQTNQAIEPAPAAEFFSSAGQVK